MRYRLYKSFNEPTDPSLMAAQHAVFLHTCQLYVVTMRRFLNYLIAINFSKLILLRHSIFAQLFHHGPQTVKEIENPNKNSYLLTKA